MPSTLLTNANVATLMGESGYGLMNESAILIESDTIKWVGSMSEARRFVDAEIIDCRGGLITPGLIDCHTHLVYGGDRADEFEQRLEGLSYSEIAERGGGIRSSVAATRQASQAELLQQAKPRLQQLLDEGVTTIEIKSGYGLDCENEIKMLRVASSLGDIHDLRVCKTFLGAHALPLEFANAADEYIDLVCSTMLPQAAAEGLVDAVDVFIETIAFDTMQARKIFDCASALGLPLKAHVEQLSNIGGTQLACEYNALSVDHIEYLRDDEVPELAETDTVAVLLPGAYYVLRETQLPPLESLRKHRVPIAIASDANPGSSPLHSILLTMNMACTLFGLTPAEALRGTTLNAAKALGLDDQIGSLEPGKQADLVIWDVHKPSMLVYQIGLNPCAAVMRAGRWRKPPVVGEA